MTKITDDELLKLITTADDKALADGVSPKGRWMPVISGVMDKLGYQGYVLSGGRPEIVDRILALHRSLYRPSDIGMGALHGGTFMFRDIFARVHVPIIFGEVQIDFFKLTDLNDQQLQWLANRPADLSIFIDQCIDIFDFGGGIGNLGTFARPPEEAMKVFQNAAFQLQAASASLSAAFDYRGAVQSALIGAELALKGGLAAVGDSTEVIRSHGHKLHSAATSLWRRFPNFDLERVLRVVSELPNFVENRYSPVQPGRIETGHIVMGCQYIAGEVMRQVTRKSIRSNLSPVPSRAYPV